MPIGEPPVRLSYPNIYIFPAGSPLERVHDRNYGSRDFNPCQGAPTRFAPIRDDKGECVPSLYAASSLEAAIYETIFHDIPVTAKRKTVPRKFIQSRIHSRLRTLRDLRLALLHNPDLMKWGLDRNSLITTSPKQYRHTARWAEAIHHQFPDIEGLLWTSNQCDPAVAYIFFGDRVASTDFKCPRSRDGMMDLTFLVDVCQVGRRSEIEIIA